MHCVSVEFEVRPGAEADFVARVAQQAADSLRLEEGCHVFDVWQGGDSPLRVFLYEVYTDAAAFEAHLGMDHFNAFDAEVADCVADKRVRRWEEVRHGT
ncbi:hypothetical protein OG2516_17865 [Oceanicola granulosus HTCC2516]|uniref:ABM domain-containing protein n=1 Tax=Oceanicola granulosus (strain ATCC BAA-861 / DSM 15982 / KCTC 12143 / HTCC2516) TaxID=314256 RepID=Q2CF07_OCEGH|nr:putative quinol monooxygenase [Oceanicola granulosus]EAR51320.1 hypothetical protein OG2516_17865 [Oceanicola granulosus HTCC2516]